MIRKTDRNHKQVIDDLRKEGMSVFSTHTIGKGFPDIVVGHNGKNYLFEIKDGAKTRSQTKLTESEREFHNQWKGQINIILNSNQAKQIINAD